ncbi:MAG: NAD(P)H-dependent oxidoreductase [Candidatus Altimarinota bacterium]
MALIDSLKWRYATKKFDTEKVVMNEDLDTILEAIRLAPASLNLQAYKIHVVKDQETKDKIQAVAWNQAQIGTCSHLLVFTARTDLIDAKEELFSMLSGGDAHVRNQLAGYEGMVSGLITGLEASNSALAWSAKQSYIALGFGMVAAAELRIDSCPMEGFDGGSVGEILSLPPSETAVVMLPIGYRAEGEGPRSPEKVRLPKDALFV